MATPTELLDTIKTAAIDKVRRGASPGWLALAEMAVLRASARQPFFTTDEVWEELTKDGPAGTTTEPRALGAVMRDMAKRGTIKATASYKNSARRECHSRPVKVWGRG